LEFKILRFFIKNKWWLTSRTSQNTNSKHKNFTIFPLILRVIDVIKIAFSASENAENNQFFHGVAILNFEVIYEEQVMVQIQKHTNHDFET
jgi:hypothetical protein